MNQIKPIKLRIRRKTKVYTNKSSKYLYRQDWKLAGVIEYGDSCNIFKCLGGLIENDAQFAKLLFDNYGKGIYSLLAWQKGYQNFWGFIKIELTPTGFKRLPKNLNEEMRDILRNRKEIKRLQKIQKQSSDKQREEIQNDIDDLNDEISCSNEIKKLDTKSRGCKEFLKTTTPLYKGHAYEDYKNITTNEKKREEKEINDFW